MMNTFSNMLILILLIFTLSCNENKNENKIEDQNKWYNNDFHLQMLFLPSFKSACFVEIYNRKGTRILSMSPMREGYFDDEHFIKFSKSQCTISESEFENFGEAINNIDLKTIKSDESCFVDGISIYCGFTAFSKDTNFFDYQSPDEKSDYQKLSISVLSLCADYFTFHPNSQVIQDIYHYFSKITINRKRNIDRSFNTYLKGSYTYEFNDSLIKSRYDRLFKWVYEKDTLLFPDLK